MTNKERFRQTLERHYIYLFSNDPSYAFVGQYKKAAELAEKMTNSLAAKTANKDGEGIKRTCKELGIKYTYAAIQQYLGEHANVS